MTPNKIRGSRLFLACGFVTALLFAPSVTVANSASFKQPEKIQPFINRLVSKHGFGEQELKGLLDEAKHRQDIIDLMTRPAEAKPWDFYRRIFVTDKRIQRGIRFWKDNETTLREASEKFGVDPEMIVAIIGVETMYGGNMGSHRVLDALATLAFSYPPRSKFFTKELENFLLLTREEDVPVTSMKGSYAGAMGYGQFIPSSYRHYAVDGDGDGKRDLLGNRRDAIFSVANYFARHGWKKNQPIAERLISGSNFGTPTKGLKPDRTVRSLRERSAVIDKAPSGDSKVSLMRLKTGAGQFEYWVGFHNFYVITRYNHSHRYAMAAYQLSLEIEKGFKQAAGAQRAD